MIIFLKNGRLGNQVLQYIGLKKKFPSETHIFLGFGDFVNCFKGLEGIFLIPNLKIRGQIFLRSALNILCALRIFGQFEEVSHVDFEIKEKPGIFPVLVAGSNVFFQHVRCVDEYSTSLVFNSEVMERARSWMLRHQLCETLNEVAFVHIRRGDYLTWPSNSAPAALPLEWYNAAMKTFQQSFPHVKFVIVSDDINFCKINIPNDFDCVFSMNSEAIDLAIISLCAAGGIMSPSTFSFAGALLSRRRNFEKLVFIGPKYWIGHRLRKWSPDFFEFEWIVYR